MSLIQEVIDRELRKRLKGKKLDKRQKRTLAIKSLLESKALSLQGTFKARLEVPENADPETEAAISESMDIAVSERLDEIISGLITQDIFDASTKTYRRATKAVVPNTVVGFLDNSKRPIGSRDLLTILNLGLADAVKSIMNTGNHLKWQTGRLGNSGNVEGINQTAKGVSLFFNYMVAPYSVFDSGGARHRAGGEPKELFRQAIRASLKSNLSNYDQFRFNVYNRSFE